MENINYKLDQFEGPLDLLLTLITKNKIDINDIPIALLCEQYMEYITAAENESIELASEFLVMASELMLIKSRMLLPKREDEEDPRATLVEAVLEYQRAKQAASEMNIRYATYGLRMVKEQDEISVDKTYVADHAPELLKRALERALTEVRFTDDRAKERFEPLVSRPQVSVSAVASVLIRDLRDNGQVYLDSYFAVCRSKSELVAKFMAVLELLRQDFLMVSDEELDTPDGVVDASSHIRLSLCGEIDEDAIRNMFDSELTMVEN